MKKSLIELSISSVVALVGVTGFWVGMPVPIVEQALSQVSEEDELAEAERLFQQVVELYQQGKYAEAISLAEKVLAIRKKVLGDNHPDVAESINNLAVLYLSQGRYTEAEPLYQESLAIMKEKLGDNHPNVATSLNNLAELYRLQGRYTEAEPLYQESLAITKEKLGDNHPSVATSLNNLAALYLLQGRYTEAESLYQESLAIMKEKLGDNHPSVATSLNNLAFLYSLQGRYTEAEPLYQESLAITKELLGDNHPSVATSLNNLALLYRLQGRYTEAEPLFQQSLAIIKEKLGDNHPDVATSLNNLAVLYRLQGRYTEAEPLYQQSLDIRQEQLGDNHPDVARSLNNLALLYQSQGRYTEAEPLYQQSLAIIKEKLGDNHPSVATSLSNLAGLYKSQGRYTEAEPLYQQSLAIRKEQLGDNHPSVATSLNNLAGLYYSQGRYTEVEPLYQESLAITKDKLGDNHPDVATSLNNLAFLYTSQGRYIEAEPLYQQSLAIRKEQLGDNHPDVATSLSNLAGLYKSQGRYTEAEPLYQQSLAIIKEKLGDNHLDVAIILENLAGLYYSQGKTTDAVKILSQGLAVAEHNLSQNLVAGDELQKQEYMKKISRGANIAISLNLQSALNNSEATRLALKTIFERKGRILDFLTNSLQILRQRTDDSGTQKFLNQLIAKRTQLSNLIFKKLEDFPSPEVYRELLTNVEKEVKELEGKLSERSAEFGNLSQPITIEKMQQQIPADTALVELVRYKPFNPKAPENERFGKPRYAAYILYQTGEPQAIDLGEAEPIDKTVEKLRKYLRNSNVPLEQLKRSARKLDQMVMQPVRQLLGETKTILLSPDAALNLIPFEALVDENNQYLVENYQITYLTSGRDLLRQNLQNNRQTPLVIANPKYQQQGEKVALENYRSIDLSDFVFLPLGGTQLEAETISQLFPEALTLTKTKATENALKQVKNPDFLHIATHGFFLSKPTSENSTDFDNPLFRSGLVFAGVEKQQSGGDDGVFTAYEATLLNLVGTQLVVLSACDTGIGDISAGEGIYGLRRAFVIAGSESQMISLWKVED
ncbi:MAG: tetratricopeptide repeat protein, partial [Okeania sp. SIO3I5]|uniref:CHAT domain-containing tetratricopeptide repeat protein n=1 Tax=Okeania sp. SIO3I5 TaxID=2607805 RepID=UPI0013B75E84